MKLTLKKVREFRDSAIEKKREMSIEFTIAHGNIYSDNPENAIETIAQYNFWGGYAYAMEKIEQFMRFKK
jgi:hypothetical protein